MKLLPQRCFVSFERVVSPIPNEDVVTNPGLLSMLDLIFREHEERFSGVLTVGRQ